jgi:ATP-dependent helicase HrpB
MLGALRKTQITKHETRNEEAGHELTERGRVMLGLPVHVRIGRMLLAAAGTKWLGEAVNAAAMLSEDSRGARGGELLSGRVPGHLERAREQLWSVAKGLRAEAGAVTVEGVEDLLLLAYPDRVAKRRGADPHAAVMVGGVGLRLMPESLTPAIAASDLFLALETHHDPRNRRAETMVRTAIPIDEGRLERLFPGQLRTETAMEFDAAREKVVGVTRRYFGDLVLSEDPHGKVDAERAGAVLAEALRPRARELILRDEAAVRFLARLAVVRHFVPEKVWPAIDEAGLRGMLAEASAGKRTVAEVRDGLLSALRGALVYPLDRELEKLAPETIEVPSGSRIKLEYALPTSDDTPPPAPVLAVRLQELFGWTETPRICNGRVPVLLHLLSPGFKPMQVTSDLASFWRSAYFEVRKDLRVRYPKHKWPEDPLTAEPEAKGRRRT